MITKTHFVNLTLLKKFDNRPETVTISFGLDPESLCDVSGFPGVPGQVGSDLCFRNSIGPVLSLTTCACDVFLGGAGSFLIGRRAAVARPIRSPDLISEMMKNDRAYVF